MGYLSVLIVSKLLLHLSKVDILIFRLFRLSISNTLDKDQVDDKMREPSKHVRSSQTRD